MKKKTGLKTMLKWLAVFAMMFTLALPASGKECKASSGTEPYTVQSGIGYLVLRTEPEKDDKNIIAEVYNGEEVTVISKEDNTYWYVSSTRLGLCGYVNKNYLTPAVTQTNGNYWTVKVSKGYLALRNAKAYDSRNEIGELYTGDVVEVTDTSGGQYWCVYSPKHGKSGYVNKDYLVAQNSTSTAPVVSTNNGYWTVEVAKGYLALRTAKAYDSRNEIGELYTGDMVEVMDASDAQYWYVYSPKYGMSGYVNKDYLRSNVTGDTHVVKVSKGYLALRTAKAYDERNEIGELYTGDTVRVIDSSDAQYWYVFSPKHNKEGYVNKDYLYANSGTVVTSITKVVQVSKGYLALRTAKAYDERNEIGELYSGDVVHVKDTSDNQYWYVYSPKHCMSGYVNKDYLY